MNKNAHSLFGRLSLLLVAVAMAIPAHAATATYTVDDPKGRDVVSFTSDAPVELIVGHTNKVTGTITLDDSLDFAKKPLSATFDVDLASIDTGIALRNEHMRDNFLETNKYPKATFKVESAAGSPASVLKDKQTIKVDALGTFSLHGKSMRRHIPVDVTYFKSCPSTQGKFENCDLIQIKSTFPVPFKDYAINRPQVVFQKLADTVFVTIAVTARREAAPAKSNEAEKPAQVEKSDRNKAEKSAKSEKTAKPEKH
jgi:polyisoprenoid-binding protein YceI